MMERLKIALPVIGDELENYKAALLAVDMEPVLLDHPIDSTEGYAGLLLPGGWDIDPIRFG